MGADAVLHQHGQMLRWKGRGQLQQGVLLAAAQQRAVIVNRRERGGEEDGSLAPRQRLPEQERRVQAEQPHAHRAARLGDRHVTLVIELGGALEGMEPEEEFQQALAEVGGLVAGEPGFGFFEGVFQRLGERVGELAAGVGRAQNRQPGRASVLASPELRRWLQMFGLARTLALPDWSLRKQGEFGGRVAGLVRFG